MKTACIAPFAPTVVSMISLLPPSTVAADVIDASFLVPAIDRWMYPFNAMPGSRPDVPTFGAAGIDDFDDRDGQMIVAFDTQSQIPPGLGADGYAITTARVVLTTIVTGTGDLFIYDPTFDSYRTHLAPDHPDFEADDDAGRPIELFGVGFRYGFTPPTFPEDAPYAFGDPIGEDIRSAFALGALEDGAAGDVSNNVRDEFEASPFAIGQADVAPGETVPGETIVVFDLDVQDPFVASYLREAMHGGHLFLSVATLHPATQGDGAFPRFYTKENALAPFFDYEARLELTVELVDESQAPLTGFEVVTGQLLGGGLIELQSSDDASLRVRSGFGDTFADLHHGAVLVRALTSHPSPAAIDVAVESRISHPSGTLQFRLRDWNTGALVPAGSRPVGQADTVATFENLDAARFISGSGEIEAMVKHVVFVPFFAFTFETAIDAVSFTVR